ncbi:Metallo-beta-lactamase superfamily protein [Paramicrobacterium humi]|uniref:Metallo-beta-lactamase superfamily protein n=1 Tax=Paramicrobacterium humi TaxID=640635 RepID=A0A1H4LH31_9MICO|nr:MBL fold metallo-hydrolase [Microbacterium humi]SEB70029.1 Metallo-beta-lactamase superfamily protein [Microbacterium humi]
MVEKSPVLWLCATCGVEYAPSMEPPAECPICEDERQYVPATGQRWTTLDELRDTGHFVEVFPVADRLWGIRADGVGIDQQGMLVQTEAGNLLFDVPGLIDAAAIERVRELGGIRHIVASHPHMYGAQSAWSEAFENATIWVAEADKRWLGYRPDAVRTWSEPFEVLPGIRLDQIGGHFPGSTLAHWSAGADGRGMLFAGDAIFPTPDGNVTFLRSYPNRIPLSAAVIRRMADFVSRFDFDVLYNNFGSSAGPDAATIVQFSAKRYIDWVSGANDDLT